MSKKILTGDDVIVLSGRDKGKRGKILSFVSDSKVVVEGVNLVKKHVRPNPVKGTTGGVVDKIMPIHVSNVAIFNSTSGKADRVRFIAVEGKKQRVFASSGEFLPVKP